MKISIITPIYHGKKYISNILCMIKDNVTKCITDGKKVKIEFVLVNDSPEEEIYITNPYDNLFDLVIISNDTNSGIHQSRVNGLLQSSGDYIIFLDQDDILFPNAIGSYLDLLDGTDLVISNGYMSMQDNRKPIYKNRLAHKASTDKNFYAFCTSMIVSPGHTIIRREAIPVEWIANPLNINGSDDYFLWLLCLDKRINIRLNNEYVYEHVGTDENFSNDRRKMYESSKSFCDVIVQKKLLSDSLRHKIVRRTNVKQRWNSEKITVGEKMFTALTNLDLLFFNIIYKMLFL